VFDFLTLTERVAELELEEALVATSQSKACPARPTSARSSNIRSSKIGIDVTTEFPKPWTAEVTGAADVAITMGCGDVCPINPGKRCLGWELAHPGRGVRRGRPPDRGDIDAGLQTPLNERGVPVESRVLLGLQGERPRRSVGWSHQEGSRRSRATASSSAGRPSESGSDAQCS
jgi:hypothetical protein